jgi:hypothetical protein
MIETWNVVALQPETEHAIAQGIQLVDKEQFDRLIFGERIADFNRFIELNLDRIRGSGKPFLTTRIADASQYKESPEAEVSELKARVACLEERECLTIK